MKNLTISLDDETHQASRVLAAKRGMSMSRLVASLLRREASVDAQQDDVAAARARIEAVERFIAGPKFEIAVDGKMPTSEERNARR
jgi:plasmid stability protein